MKSLGVLLIIHSVFFISISHSTETVDVGVEEEAQKPVIHEVECQASYYIDIGSTKVINPATKEPTGRYAYGAAVSREKFKLEIIPSEKLIKLPKFSVDVSGIVLSPMVEGTKESALPREEKFEAHDFTMIDSINGYSGFFKIEEVIQDGKRIEAESRITFSIYAKMREAVLVDYDRGLKIFFECAPF